MAQKTVSTPYMPAALSVASRAFTYRFFLSACFLVLVLFSLALEHSGVGIFILVLLNVLFCADLFVRAALKDLASGKLTLAVLIVGCVYAGFLYSALNTFLTTPLAGPTPDLYLYTSLLITLALWAQRRLVKEKEKARIFIKKLDDFLPKSGRVCVGRQFRKVFAREIKKGDLIYVKPGERLPADGIIRQGKTSIDEQLITGNMLPSSKTTGSRVYAGTLNKSAATYIEVTDVLDSSALMSVINAVKTGEKNRSSFKSELDSFGGKLFPLLLTISAGVYAYALYLHGATRWFHYLGVLLFVLALLCPAAVLFAVIFPSFFARSGARTRKIKLQNMYALDEIVRADTLFFDKTGTLTYGELSVSGLFPAEHVTETELLTAVANAEQLVDGPFAQAVNACAKEHKIKTKRLLCFDVLPGLGVQATCGKDKIVAGRTRWFEEQGIAVSAKTASAAEAIICVAKNGKFLGYLTLADRLRPGAADLVQFLKAQGKDIILVSGDNESSVAEIAKEAGIEKFNFDVLPKTKAEIVTNLRGLGKKVVMVGDGFNDIIALLRADAGVVFASGKSVYSHWVDVIIRGRDLYPISYLFKINKKLRRVIFQNVCLAVLCNGVLTAWLVWAKPAQAGWQLVAGGALGAILLVLLNSTRMLNVK